MGKKLQGLLAGVVLGTMLVSGTAFAKQAVETIKVTYDNIKILIDGVEYTPKDAGGNIVEPFIYNGTTYLPVRAIANAFDKDVDWEAQTSTVTIGSKNYDWLDQIGYVDYETTYSGSDMKAIATGTKAGDGIKYDRGVRFTLHVNGNRVRENNDGSVDSYQEIEYLLNGNYKTFTGNFIDLNSYRGNQGTIVKIYGDGGLIYTSPIISYGSKTTPFSIDVSDYKILKIHVEIPNLSLSDGSATEIGIADARLAKK